MLIDIKAGNIQKCMRPS